MKKLFLALLFLSLPLAAQTITPCGDPTVGCQGAITSSSSGGDAVQLFNAWGQQWSTARFKVISAGTATATLQVTSDGLNWVAAPYAKRVSTATANPTTQAITATTLTTGDVWEVALPGNNYGVQVLCAGTGTATTVTLYGWQRYSPGAVKATLFDVTSATNTAIDTGVIDLSGWASYTVQYTTPAGGSGAIKIVDDSGTATSLHTVPASAGVVVGFGDSGPTNVTAVATTGTVSIGAVFKRMQFTSAAVSALTSRIRVEAHR